MTGKHIKVDDIVPLGSLTKSFTAAGIVQSIQSGKMGWNDTISSHINEIIKNESRGKGLLDFFGDFISEVTIYQLVFMTSGLDDYDDEIIKQSVLTKPDHDWTPIDYISGYSGEFLFAPGTNYAYTSIGYILLQYALAAQAGAKTWEDYDQMSVLPKYLRKEMKHTHFINRGRCSAFEKIGMVHTYESKKVHRWPATQFSFLDYWEKTCANGWGFGNIALSATDSARFWYEYMGTENIISKEMQ